MPSEDVLFSTMSHHPVLLAWSGTCAAWRQSLTRFPLVLLADIRGLEGRAASSRCRAARRLATGSGRVLLQVCRPGERSSVGLAEESSERGFGVVIGLLPLPDQIMEGQVACLA